MQDEQKTKTMAENYNDLIMLDFTEVCEQKPNELAFFLNEPENLVVERTCNMQMELSSNKLPKFST